MDNKEELNKLIKQLEDLQIQQEAVIKKIRGVSTEETPPGGDRPTPTGSKETEGSFRVGEKILIKNRLGHITLGRRASIKDRVGSIIKITNKRIHIKTYNGSDTSRAPHNVTRLTEEEYQDILKKA